MEDYGSFQVDPEMPSTNDIEDVELLSNHQSTTPESSEGGSASKRRARFGLLAAMSLWFVVMAAELSPFWLILSRDEYRSDDALDASAQDDDDDYSRHDLWGASTSLGIYNIRPCSMKECLLSPCEDAATAPFSCMALSHNHDIRGGCGPTPWTREICADQCDTTGCLRLLEHMKETSPVGGIDDEDCDVPCPKSWCNRNRLCGESSAPYQCISGQSVYGCSADRLQWTLRSTRTECSSCCKTTTCGD